MWAAFIQTPRFLHHSHTVKVSRFPDSEWLVPILFIHEIALVLSSIRRTCLPEILSSKTFQGKESCQQFQIIDVELTFYWEPVSPRSNAIALAALARVTSVWLDSYLRIRGRNLVLWVMRVFQPPLELISGIWCEKSVAVIIPFASLSATFLHSSRCW